jgi:thiol-disulfide isomerase/thioredoxin
MERQPGMIPAPGTARRRLNWRGIIGGLVVPGAVLALIVGGLWYWQSRDGSSNSPYGTVSLPAEKNPTGESPAPRVGRAGPDFILEKPGGGALRLSDLQGQPVLLNFWASWCAPCRSEVPELIEAYTKYESQGLIIVGVDLQEADSNVQEFAQEFGITYPLVIDRDGEVGNVWRIGGPFQGLPSSYFIDSKGVVRASYPGQLTPDLLEEKLGTILPGAGG